MENQNNFYPEKEEKAAKEKNNNAPVTENLLNAEKQAPSMENPIDGGQQQDEEYVFAPVIYPQAPTVLLVDGDPIPKGHSLETFTEKKAIKRVGNTIGVSFLALFGAVLIINFALTLVAFFMVLVTKEQSAADFINDPFFTQILQILLSSFMFTLPFIIVYRAFKIKWTQLLSFKKPIKRRCFPLFLFGIGFCAFANVASSIIASFLERLGIEQKDIGLENPEGIYGFLIVIISTAVVPALVEEFACRGLVMGLLRKYSDGFAIIVSAIIFGVMHGNFQQIPFATLAGLALGFIAIKTESLWPAVAVHFFNNLSAVVFSYLPFSVNLTNILYTIFLCVCMLLGLLSVLLVRNDRDLFKLKNEKLAIGEGKKYSYFFTSVPIIITLVYGFLEAVMFLII